MGTGENCLAGPGEEKMVGDETHTWAIPDMNGVVRDPTASAGDSSSNVIDTYDHMKADQESDQSSQTPLRFSQKTEENEVH
jgi:hypothetical protein